jgi:hypothetical protein
VMIFGIIVLSAGIKKTVGTALHTFGRTEG